MKFVLVFLLITFPFVGQSQGIQFESLTFEEALQKAKKEHKLIFMDCYTTWCGPCKVMSEKVFTQFAVGDYFNGRFVNLKIDMEKEEGKELAKRFSITAYPTFLLIKKDGSILFKMVGGCDADTFISKMEAGQDEKNSLAFWNEKYEAGKIKKVEVLRYINLLMDAGENEKIQSVAALLWEKLSKKERVGKKYWPLYSNRRLTSYGTEYFEFLLNHRNEFVKSMGKTIVDNQICRVYTNFVTTYIWGNLLGVGEYPQVAIRQIIDKLQTSDIEGKEVILAKCRFAQARHEYDCVKMIEQMNLILPTAREDELWGLASAFYRVFDKESCDECKVELKKLGDAFVTKAKEEELKGYLKRCFNRYE